MDYPRLSRRRYIPDEIIDLDDDEILLFNDEVIVTKWRVLKPRNDFVRGYSCVFYKMGFKLSKFIDAGNECKYLYCDIIETTHFPEENRYVFNDLLVDVLVYPDGRSKVLDLDEIATALDNGLITLEQAKKALLLTNELLAMVYSGEFNKLTHYLSGLE